MSPLLKGGPPERSEGDGGGSLDALTSFAGVGSPASQGDNLLLSNICSI